MRALLLLLATTGADALRATLATPRRAPPPAAKLFSRNQLDFGNSDSSVQDFGLQGHILGLAPGTRPAILLGIAFFVARAQPLPVADLAFAAAFPAYLLLANYLRFDLGNDKRFKPLLREGRGAWLKRYVLTTTLLGLMLPLPLVFLGPRSIALAAAPHLFLTAIQCAFEGLTAHSRFAAVLRVAVPIGFNAYRLGTLRTWCAAAATTVGAGTLPVLWAWSALALALANSVLWSYNLFIFLLLRVVPQYFDAGEFPTPPTTWYYGLLPMVDADETKEAAVE